MVLMQSADPAPGTPAPDFSLRGTDEKIWTLEECRGPEGLVVMFICNHCPYVKAIMPRLVPTAQRLIENGIGCAAIMPNDIVKYPADGFEKMVLFAEKYDFPFPYLLDETQETARSYGAVCTPDFFGYDRNLTLAYRGRLDNAGQNEPEADTHPELLIAMLSVARGDAPPPGEDQHPSMGCSIKWAE